MSRPSPLRVTRRRAATLAALAAVATAASAGAVLIPLGAPLGLVNDDPAAGFTASQGAVTADVAGGALAANGAHVPWAVFEQNTPGATRVFSRSFANGTWTTRGTALNVDAAQDAEAPSIDFAGPGRTVPWASWYEASPGFGATQIFASRFDAAGGGWLAAGQDRAPGQKLPSLNINTDFDAENPAIAGGSTAAGGTPEPWVAWQELDGSAIPANRRDQIFVSRGVKAGAGQTACTGFSPGDGPVVNGFCWQETGIARVSRTSLKADNATDPSLNVDTSRNAIEPDVAFTGPGDTVPWVVWYETGPSGRGLRGNDMVFAAKAVKDDAAEGGFRWVAVGRGGTGILDASETGGPCAAGISALDGCSLNANPAAAAEDPRIAAGTMTPGAPTVPWIAWSETGADGTAGIYVARLVSGERFVIANAGRRISTPGVDAGVPDITFAGNTPFVTWREGAEVRTGHFEGTAADPVFTADERRSTGSPAIAPRISSGCTATPATADGTTCPGGAAGSPFVLFGDGPPAAERLLGAGYQPEQALTSDATGVTATSATLNGVAVTGGGPVRVRFEFGPTTAYGSTTPATTIAPTRAATAFAAAAAGLPAGATTHFRSVVEGDFGRVTGPDRVVTTPAPPAPVVNAAPRVRVSGLAATVRTRGGAPVVLRLRLSVNEASVVTVRARRAGRIVGTVAVRRASAGAFTVRLRAGRGGGRVALGISARDGAGAVRVVTRSVRIVIR